MLVIEKNVRYQKKRHKPTFLPPPHFEMLRILWLHDGDHHMMKVDYASPYNSNENIDRPEREELVFQVFLRLHLF